MYMLTGDIVMFEYDVGLFPVAECLHIFLGYLRKKFIREFLVRVRIK